VVSEWTKEDLIRRLQEREHHFRNAVEGEYDAELLKAARFALTSDFYGTIPIYRTIDATDEFVKP
jgi:hypothetical protein